MLQHLHDRCIGASGRTFLWDCTWEDTTDYASRPLLLLLHGFKGFKDWGHWNALAVRFADAGYAFAKLNFSHNGTTPEQPQDFADLEAFGNNNYSKELYDIKACIDALPAELTRKGICLIGHSRGGPIALLQAAADPRVVAVMTWAAVARLDYAWQGAEAYLEDWHRQGVIYLPNARTGQQMPLYYQLYEDFVVNRERLSLPQALQNFSKPWLIVHGSADSSVSDQAARELAAIAAHARLHIIEGADHTFGGKHPFVEPQLPEHSQKLAELCLDWLKELEN